MNPTGSIFKYTLEPGRIYGVRKQKKEQVVQIKHQTKRQAKQQPNYQSRYTSKRRKGNRAKTNGRRHTLRAAALFFMIITALFGDDIRQLETKQGKGQREAVSSGELQELEVHYLDIGQGDATLLLCDGHAMLIDAGNNSRGDDVQSYLGSQKVHSLDYMIGTHPDADHIGGMDTVLYQYPVGQVFLPDCEKDTATYGDVAQAVSSQHKEAVHPKPGGQYMLGDAECTILGPLREYSDANNNSICLKVKHGANTFLFTGDAEEEAEEDLVSSRFDLSADVYKVSHHGSRTATTAAFFEQVGPIYAVISCGEGNSYGHPHAEVLNRLRAAGVQMFRTDDQGTVVVNSDGTDLTFHCSPSDNWTVGE